MTLVFEQAVAGPATHALVIGVGGYDHLDGGASDHKLEPAGKYGNLGQLTSPPKSACAFAAALTAIPREDWLAPLGTVDLLVSTAPGDDDPGGTGGPYERATRTAIQEAFDRWWVRCESNPDNVAVFFFCGHGLQASSHVLLPTDFGATGNPWAQAIDFNRTRDAFLTNKAKTQVFLVDACREVTTSTVEVPSPNAPPLREPEVRQTNRCEHDLTVQSTTRTKKAYGEEGAVSYFTAGVINGLQGGASKRESGAWWVKTDLVASRIRSLVKIAGGTEQRPSAITTGVTRLMRVRVTPDVRLDLACEPEVATELANLALTSLSSGTSQTRARGDRQPWSVVVPAGVYRLEATFEDPTYTSVEDVIPIEPPDTRERLAVQ